MKLLFVSLIILLLLLQYRLWVGNGSLTDVHHLQQAKEAQLVENQALQDRNDSLTAEVADLKQGLEAIEERARSEMGMIQHDESFYRVIDQTSSDVIAKE